MTQYSDRDAVIVGAVRTPVGKGKPGGSLHHILPADLLAHSLRAACAAAAASAARLPQVQRYLRRRPATSRRAGICGCRLRTSHPHQDTACIR